MGQSIVNIPFLLRGHLKDFKIKHLNLNLLFKQKHFHQNIRYFTRQSYLFGRLSNGAGASLYDFAKRHKPRMTNSTIIGDIEIYPWSISGIETSISIHKDNLNVAFDMGFSHREAVRCPYVFISHGHIDHIAAIPQHAAKRDLYSMKPATYYMPGSLIDSVKKICDSFSDMHEHLESLTNINLQPIELGESIQFAPNWTVEPFATKHRVESQGYILYHQRKHLKEEYKKLSSQEIGKRVRAGEQVHNVVRTPEIAYTGDTMFDIFHNPDNGDLLKVKLLITECTYIDNEVDFKGKTSVEKARERGHTHLQEIVVNLDILQDVQSIMLVHFSDKYSSRFIQETVMQSVPAEMRHKVFVSTLAKELL
ncbi:unnamed protein product [Owenia fusiformis]|uniref:Metallo-beta-lactamase domain-containing protein n=1 Tax=Owenia fusiformis TaxID=6347 RepID=A0A8J1TNG7_OWEFU|nr:unnamed protein product [Owenia fusiformis]